MGRKPLEMTMGANGVPEIKGSFTEETPEKRTERKRFSTLCGHVKRRLLRDERLTGSVLECALMAAGDEGIVEKLKNGEKLSDYEKHLMIDVWLLHLRLGA